MIATAKIGVKGGRVLLGGYDLSGFLNAAEDTTSQATIRADAWNTTGPRRVVDNYDFGVSVTAMYDGADNQIDEILNSIFQISAEQPISVVWGPQVEGGVSYDSMVHLEREPISGQLGQLVMVNSQFIGASYKARAVILADATVTGVGNRTGRNQGVTVSGQTYAAVIRVLGGTFTSITVQIQESQNDGGADPYALITGMSATLTAIGATRVSTTAATEAWKRAAITAFTGTNAVLFVSGGVAAGT